jgi:hypothetical protein
MANKDKDHLNLSDLVDQTTLKKWLLEDAESKMAKLEKRGFCPS